MRDGPAAGLELVDALPLRGGLEDCLPAHAARADLRFRLGRTAEARASFSRGLELGRQDAERRYFARRIRELDAL